MSKLDLRSMNTCMCTPLYTHMHINPGPRSIHTQSDSIIVTLGNLSFNMPLR